MKKLILALSAFTLTACASAEPTPEQKKDCQSAQPGIVNSDCPTS